jgi:hypothetical protein
MRDRLVDQADELGAIGVVAGGALSQVANLCERPVLGVLAVAQEVREGGDGKREPEVGGGVGERLGGAADHRKRGFGGLVCGGLLVPDAEAAEGRMGELAFGGELEFVERGDLMACADLAGVDLVVAEVVVFDVAVLVADEAVARDQLWVEVDLELDVLGDDFEGRAELLLEDLFRRG